MDENKIAITSTQIFHFFSFAIFIARDVGGVHENVYNLFILLQKLKYAFRKICNVEHRKRSKVFKPKQNIQHGQPSN